MLCLSIAQTVGGIQHGTGTGNWETFAENNFEVTPSNTAVVICSHW
jgi:hypothetical protein